MTQKACGAQKLYRIVRRSRYLGLVILAMGTGAWGGELLEDWHGEFETTFGSYELKEYRAALAVPLIQDHLQLGLATDSRRSDGYVTAK